MPPKDGRVVVLLALVAAGIAYWIHGGLLERAPHVDDEASYLFQAEALRHGSLWGPASPFGVQVPFTLGDGERLAGVFPNGWPAVLAFAMLLGLPWGLVNPALLGLVVWRGAALAGDVGGPSARVPTALLLALSPALLLLGASAMSHTLVALCWVVAWDLWRRPSTLVTDMGLGLVLGLTALTRPLCGVVLCVCLVALAPRSALRWARVAVPMAIAAGLQLWQNLVVTDDAFQFAVNRWFDGHNPTWPGSNQLGFGPGRGHMHGVEGHDLGHAFANTVQNLSAWNQLLLGPGLLVLPLAALWWRRTRVDLARWLGASAALIVAYGLYWYVGTCYGARFYHAAAPLLLMATGIGLSALPSRGLRIVATGGICISQALALSLVLPELQDYRGLDGRLAEIAASWEHDPAVVLVTATAEPPRSRTPVTGPEGVYYSPGLAASVAPHAAVWPDSTVWFAVANDQNYALAQQSGREVWLYRMGPQAESDHLERLGAAEADAGH